MCVFQSGDYRTVVIFAEKDADADGDGDGWICLSDQSGEEQHVSLGQDLYRRIQLPLQKEGLYRLETKGIRISQMYLSDCPELLERGVRFLDPDTGKGVDLKAWYDTPVREQYHFAPFVNWANDPNGLCWYQGYYHLFYQANPYGQVWNDMYWAHAVSRDLVHWTHLPHVLEPQKELWSDKERKGGAFSGCALAGDGEIELILTRHDGPQKDGEQTREWQTRAVCRDGIHVEDECELISDKPEGTAFDFRDPKAGLIDGNMYMVLGACVNRKPSILLYRKENDGKWHYEGPLLQEGTRGIRTFECPDFFKLDGRYVALGAWMCHYDEEGRYQMTRCYIGDFDGRKLQVCREQWYDFGSNFYAVQSFVHQGRRIAIGWISDFYGEHEVRVNGACGSFALPRELHVKEDRLMMTPVRECYGLLGEMLVQTGSADRIERISIPGNSYYVKLRLKGDGDFRILLAENEGDCLKLERHGQVTSLVSTREQVAGVRFPSDVAQVRDIEIFMDRRVVEVFLNGGEAAGTKLFYQKTKEGCFEAEFSEGELEELAVYSMKSIWSEN